VRLRRPWSNPIKALTTYRGRLPLKKAKNEQGISEERFINGKGGKKKKIKGGNDRRHVAN